MQTTGLKRNIIDKYYTKSEVAEECVELFKKYVNVGSDDAIIEPSAGNGSFIPGIKSITKNYIFYDIEPENEEIEKMDYMQYSPKFNKVIHVIGNPPFGRQSSLAIKFMKKSCEFCQSVSFILPKSFKKESLKNKIPLNFHLLLEKDLPNNSFLIGNKSYDVPCVFQIWEKKEKLRTITEKISPEKFIFVKKNQTPDISFRRVGSEAGKIDKKSVEKSIQSHYFIKFTNGNSIDENILILKNAIFDHNNTVGPKSISKQELTKEFNKFL